jgi:hypothetical protein
MTAIARCLTSAAFLAFSAGPALAQVGDQPPRATPPARTPSVLTPKPSSQAPAGLVPSAADTRTALVIRSGTGMWVNPVTGTILDPPTLPSSESPTAR